MAFYAWPVLFAIGVWWLFTIAIMYLSNLSPRTYRWSLPAVSGLSLCAFAMAGPVGQDITQGGAYLGFVLGLTVWAWHEMTFLTGLVTGPQTGPCPPTASGIERLKCAVGAILWHELAIIATAAALAVLTWHSPNQMALWTFCLLWGMRTSAKLNLFLGVRNLSVDLLPERTRYMASHFKQAHCNWFFPFSILTSTGLALALFSAGQPSAFSGAGYSLLGALLCLGILEHLMLVLPVSLDWLWRWGLRSRSLTVQSKQDTSHTMLPAQTRLVPAKFSD